MRFALFALAVGAFGIGTNEFVIMGLLPNVAGDVGVSIPTAGGLVSGYALGVVIGAPLLTVAVARLPRKAALVAFMAWFTLGNALSAVAPNYGLLFAARVFAGLPHGAYFGAGALVAASLVDARRRARAISMMVLGLTIANIVGVPAATLLGQHLGWRSAFWVVSGIGVLAALTILAAVPHQDNRPAGGQLKAEFGAFRSPQIWLSLAICVFGFAGVFASVSYVTPMMVGLAGYRPAAVTFLLALFGVGMTVGNLLGGRLTDLDHRRTLYGGLVALGAVLVVFTFTAHSPVAAAVTLFFVGVTGFTVGTPLQVRVMEQAPHAPTLVSAGLQSAFNTANSLGAYLGGVVIAAGFGYASPNWVGAALAAVGLTFAIVAAVLGRRSAGRDDSRSGSGRASDTAANAAADIAVAK
ncbi:MAG TPA: MFS transporter [Pseudonocardiaceae bacterium]|jgi:DHA1 family inner membrane transport protein|nr:MFS transporter [Pseudonocardiaceae bacterium]